MLFSLLSVLYWKNFPVCFVEGVGFTPFIKISEFVICLILLASILTLWLKRSEFESGIFRLLVFSLAVSVLSEIAFTRYENVLGSSNVIGHFLRLIASYAIYRAFIKTGISKPFDLVFRSLARSEQNLFSLLEGLPAFVFMQMRDGSIKFANRAFREWFPDPEDKPCYRILGGRETPCENCPTLDVFSTGLPQQREWNMIEGRIYAMYEYPYRDIDDTPAVLKLAIDITERKRMEVELLNARNEMENQVMERTCELTRINETLRAEIAERERIQVVLQKSEEYLRVLSSRLLDAQESERKRIAMELHDSLGGSLSAVKFRAENAIFRLRESPEESPEKLFGEIVPMLQGLIDEVRRIHSNIWPSLLSDLGLIVALNSHFRKFVDSYPQIGVPTGISVDENDVPDSLKIVIYRIIQEALNNVAKHSCADSVEVGLTKNDGMLELIIRDNGKGFSAVGVRACGNGGMGLTSMRERAKLSGGSLIIESGETGTVIRASWPQGNIL